MVVVGLLYKDELMEVLIFNETGQHINMDLGSLTQSFGWEMTKFIISHHQGALC